MGDLGEWLAQLVVWAEAQDAIVAVALVGSHGRGTARPDSDVDLVILATSPDWYLEHTEWVSLFGKVASLAREDYGLIQSLRVFYDDGLEVEFGLGSPEWAALTPIDPGTQRVVSDGCRILFDPRGFLTTLVSEIGNHNLG